MKYISFVLILVFFISCSRKYYEPKRIDGYLSLTGFIGSEIEGVNLKSASLEDGKFLYKNGILKDFDAKEGFSLINIEDDKAFLSNDKGLLLIRDMKTKEEVEIQFDYKVLSVSKKDNYLALLYANNSLSLYDLNLNKIVYLKRGDEVFAVNEKIASPRFLKDLVLFPTLDGKIIVVNYKNSELLKSILVSSEPYFNNIIFLDLIDDILVSATPHRIYLFDKREYRVDYPIKDIAIFNDSLYISTKYGEFIQLNKRLKKVNSMKFEFADILGFIFKNNEFYLAEKEGYIINIKKDFKNYKVYGFIFKRRVFFYY